MVASCLGVCTAALVEWMRPKESRVKPHTPLDAEQIDAAMSALQYDRSWLESGMISVENLLRQYADFGKSAYASSPEHLRLRALNAWLSYRVTFHDDEIATFTHAIKIDADAAMANGVLVSVMLGSDLTPPQYQSLLQLARERGLGDEKLAWLEFCRDGLEEAIGEARSLEWARRGVPAIEHDLAHSTAHLAVLEYLATSGGSKEVRAVAAQRLRQLTPRRGS